MSGSQYAFFQAIIAAGAILSGFCGVFLVFRIQREAAYYRQPALSYQEGKAKDVYIGLTHFTSSFLLIVLATACSMIFGFLLPLFALAGARWALASSRPVVAGLVASLIVLFAYFLDELIHYGILSTRLAQDAREWGNEWPIVIAGLLLALAAAYVVFRFLPGVA